MNRPPPPDCYADLVCRLSPELKDLPAKLIAIGGRPCAGKTTLGRFLAWHFNVSLVETDLFLLKDDGLKHRNGAIEKVIARGLQKPRPVIVDGATVLRVLSEIGRTPDYLIHVINESPHENRPNLEALLASYEDEFKPALRANHMLRLKHD